MEKTMEKGLTTVQMLDLLEDQALGKVLPLEQNPQTSALESLLNAVASLSNARKRVVELQEAMPCILGFLEKAEAHRDDLASLPSDIEGQTWAQIVVRLNAGINERLASPQPEVRRAVCLPMFKKSLGDPDPSEERAEELLSWLVNRRFLLPAKEGFAFFRRQKHDISGEFGLTEADKEELMPLIANLCRKAQNAQPLPEPEVPAPQPKFSPSDQQITAGRAWRGEFGRFDLPIPNGTKSGILTLESQGGGALFVVEATNGYADLESVSIPFFVIRDERGGIREGLKLSSEMFRSDKRKAEVARLGELLMRGFRAALEGEKNMNPRAFLSTDAVGDSVLVFTGDFDWNPPDSGPRVVLTDLTLRFARRDDGKMALTKIVSPPEAGELFEDELGEYYKPSHAFNGMPLPLGVFLRAMYGKVVQGR